MAMVVDQPNIYSPFDEPARHYRIRGATAELVDVRRNCHRVLDSWHTLVQDPVTHPAVPPVGFSAASLGRWRYVKIHTPYQLAQVLGVAESEGDDP